MSEQRPIQCWFKQKWKRREWEKIAQHIRDANGSKRTNTRSSLHNMHMLSTSRERLFDYGKDSIEVINQFCPLPPNTATIDNTEEEARTINTSTQVHARWMYPSIAAKLISRIRSECLRSENSMTKKIKSYIIFSFLLCDSIVAANTKLLTSNRRLHVGVSFLLLFPIPIISTNLFKWFLPSALTITNFFPTQKTHHYTQNQHSLRGLRTPYTFYTQNNNGFAEK